MADFNKPATTDTYANVLAFINAKFSDLALGLDPANTTPTNVPTNAVRWNSANNRFEKYNGTSWAALSSTFAFADLSASGTVTLGGGTANGVPYLNASKQLVSGSALTFDGSRLRVIAPVYVNSDANYLTMVNAADTQYQGRITQNGVNIEFFNRQAGALVFGAYDVEQMRLTNTGLVIGATSLYTGVKLQAQADRNSLTRIAVSNQNSGALASASIGMEAYGGGWHLNVPSDSSFLNPLIFEFNSTELMRLSASGNLGLAVTPSAWGGAYKAFQVLNVGRSLAATGAGAGDLTLAFNAIYSSANSRWDYAYTGDAAVRYSQTGSGIHAWFTAPSGTAGAAITFTQAMTLDASGNLLLGATALSSWSERLSVNTTSAPTANFNSTAASGGYAIWSASGTAYGFIGTATGIIGSGGANALALRSENALIFAAGGATERARIDSSGNFLVGTTSAGSPSFRMIVSTIGNNIAQFNTTSATGGYIALASSGTNYGYFGLGPSLSSSAAVTDFVVGASNNLFFVTNGNDRGKIDSNGIWTANAGNLMLVQATAQATTSGTAKDFTSIPSWAKKITVALSGVSTTGSSDLLVQLGTAGGIQTTSYLGAVSSGNNAIVTSGLSSGFIVGNNNSAAAVMHAVVTLINVTGNVWAMQAIGQRSDTTTYGFTAGSVTLSGALTTVRLTTVSGTPTFDAGNVNIIYE